MIIFCTERERLKHPYASLIPHSLWTHAQFFNQELSEINLYFLREPLENLKNKRDENYPQRVKNCAFVTLLFRYPNENIDTLVNIALQSLQLKIPSIVECIAALGYQGILLDFLKGIASKQQTEFISLLKIAFKTAAEHGHVVLLERLKEKAPGHILDLFYWIMGQPPKILDDIIQAENYSAFTKAATNNHLDVLKWIQKESPKQFEAMITANHYAAFTSVCINGHLEILQWIQQQIPTLINQIMPSLLNNSLLGDIAAKGHLAIIKWFKQQIPERLEEMITSFDFKMFWQAAKFGHLPILIWIKKKLPHYLADMIEVANYAPFRWAASNGHLTVLKWLSSQAPNQLDQMIKADDFYAFKEAAANGQLEVLDWIKQCVPELIESMIQSEKYYAFRLAAQNGHLMTLMWLKDLAAEHLECMIHSIDYFAFRLAAKHGHIDILNWLHNQMPNHWGNMIKERNYWGFREAANKNQSHITSMLLHHPLCFAFAELHDQDFGSTYIYPFVTNLLERLHHRHHAFIEQHSDQVFDLLEPNENVLYFYIARHLIRRNTHSLNNELEYLLTIPSIKELAHQSVTPHEPNELIRFALSARNRRAAGLLLEIPAVRELASQHDYYRNEQQGDFNLRTMAQDRESSMKSLTPSEQKRLEAAIQYYQPKINEAGVSYLMDSLRNTLIQRYQKNPAIIEVMNQSIALPIDWEEFNKLELNDVSYQLALKAYYQNQNHTALRYLLKPNPWMSPHADFVHVNSENLDQKWSTFDEYQPLIVMLWLAATDPDFPSTEGNTTESRFEHFISELALIGRAHNWDNSRIKNDRKEKEEYDDLEGDKPSCYSGVKRRLFQSVHDHSLFNMLSKEILIHEFRNFVREFYQSVITESNQPALKKAYADYLSSLNFEDAKPLEILNIPEQKQKELYTHLTHKYGKQFSEESEYLSLIKKMFELDPDTKDDVNRLHALKLDGIIQLGSLWKNRTTTPVKIMQIGFFEKAFNNHLITKNPTTNSGIHSGLCPST